MSDDKAIDYESVALKLGQAFQPSAPIDTEELFFGRIAQVRSVVDAINQKGRHAVLYGERGVGKTSLGKILQSKIQAIEAAPLKAPLVTCDSFDNYDSIWCRIFEVLEVPGFTQSDIDDDDAPEYRALITPNNVRKVIEESGEGCLMYVIIDEFDKVQDQNSRQLLADTIKLFSDRATPATIIVIGVAEDVTGLINDHRSIERCLAQIPMPRMPREELERIVKTGLNRVGMKVNEPALLELTGLSKGLPHYTHLLALLAGREALDRETLTISSAHVEHAILSAIDEAHESIRADYEKATYSSRETLYKSVLLACSMAETDDFGRFQPSSVCEPLQKITGRSFTTDRFASHLRGFCEPSRGPVLIRSGGQYRWKYRFENPLMQPFVTMKGIASNTISKESLNLLEDPNGQKRLFPK